VDEKKKVVLCVPTYPWRPHQATLDAIRDSVPALEAAGWEHALVHEIGNPYISGARATMLRKAIDAKASHIVFIDHDVSWRPEDLIKLIETEGGLVAGTYRFKEEPEKYMGTIKDHPITHVPAIRESDGALAAIGAPAGFMKIERWAVSLLMEKYPELCYGERCSQHFDLFNHGAHKGAWFGEDYACCRRWIDAGQELWIVPDVSVDHHSSDKVFKGNLHNFLRQQPGGDLSSAPIPPKLKAA
jgi:hypothetical protein